MKAFPRFFIFILCLSALSATSALAAQETPENAQQPNAPPASEPPDVPPPGKPSPPEVSMEAYGTSNPQCLEWTDSCQVCVRDDQNRNACSTPGIACLPGDIKCKRERK